MSETQTWASLIALFVLGVLGLIRARWMKTMAREKIQCASWLFIVLAIVGFLSVLPARIWDGGFSQQEFRLVFRNREGKPVPGVELRVENEAGSNFYLYPVTDYLPDQIPTSDKDGVLIFHHVRQGIEFSGHCSSLFCVIPVGECNSPKYICRFIYQGKEIWRSPYGQLSHSGGPDKPIVKRTWKWSDWPTRTLKESFDHNGEGKFDREEAIAYYAARTAAWRYEMKADLKPNPFEEEMEFSMVQKDISIQLRP